MAYGSRLQRNVSVVMRGRHVGLGGQLLKSYIQFLKAMLMNSEKCSLGWLSQQPHDVCSPVVVQNIAAYARAIRKERPLTVWYAQCMDSPHASVFFRATLDSSTYRITVCDLVAKAYEEVLEQGEAEVIALSHVLKLREQALSMCKLLPGPQHLPAPANTSEFRVGLQVLTEFKVPVTTPTNRSGNPTVRTLTLLLARRFADAFIHIPVEYIHYLVTIGWPSRSLSATRRLLPLSITNTLKRESEAALKLEKGARSTTLRAIQVAANAAARSTPRDAEERSLAILEGEVDRIKRGLRRFPNDAARLRAMQDIAASFDDPYLVDELNSVLSNAVREFKV
jgi:hypothetical protein